MNVLERGALHLQENCDGRFPIAIGRFLPQTRFALQANQRERQYEQKGDKGHRFGDGGPLRKPYANDCDLDRQTADPAERREGRIFLVAGFQNAELRAGQAGGQSRRRPISRKPVASGRTSHFRSRGVAQIGGN